MHSQAMEVTSNNVPAFLAKLWRLVEDESCNDLIEWGETGTTFFIRDQARISRELLPLYFKHNNVASFIRQLNMYGFRKVMHVDKGGLRVETDEIEFHHPFFIRENADLLNLIKRKIPVVKPSSGTEETKVLQPDVVNKVLLEVKNLHGKQETMDNKLADMKRENEALWREVATMRQKHMKQQQIVNQLVQFLIRLVNPNRGIIPKRKLALMIDDSRGPDGKVPRVKRTFSYDGTTNGTTNKHLASTAATIFPSSPARGPLIHDVTDAVDPDSYIDVPVISIAEPKSVDPSTSVPSPMEPSPATPLSQAVDAIYSSPVSVEMEEHDDGIIGSVPHDHNIAAEQSEDADSESKNQMNTSEDSSSAGVNPLDELIREINEGGIEPENSSVVSSDNVVALGDSSINGLDIIDHIDNVSVELESLKDLLSSSGCSIDVSTLLGLFSGEDMLSNKSISDLGDYSKSAEKTGTELMQYSSGGLSDLPDVPIFDTDLAADDDDIDDRMFEPVDAVEYVPDDPNAVLQTPDTTGLSLEAVLADLAASTPSGGETTPAQGKSGVLKRSPSIKPR